MNYRTKIIILILTSAIISFFIIGAYSYFILSKSNYFEEKITIEIPPKSNINNAIETLNNNGVIESTWFLKLCAKFYSKWNNKILYAGEYEFSGRMSNYAIIKHIFSRAKVNTIMVTFPEGLNLEEIAAIVEKELGISKKQFLELCYSDSLLKARKIQAESTIGYLYPDTYEFFKKTSLNAVVDKMLNQGEQIWDDESQIKAEKLGMSRQEILTLSSIIEAETPFKQEATTISGVYHNRLKIKMPLQADPTVQFALRTKQRLTLRDLEAKHPYNTYRNIGLPPGPINNPGAESIKAALNPENHNFLYFVAKGDGTGSHSFASSFTEHKRNKQNYRANRQARN